MAKKPKHSFFDPNNAEASAIREACMEVRYFLFDLSSFNRYFMFDLGSFNRYFMLDLGSFNRYFMFDLGSFNGCYGFPAGRRREGCNI